jgi:hypothetical protein
VNSLYAKGLEGFLGGVISWRDDAIHLILIDTAEYTVNLAEDFVLDDIPIAARVATSPELTGKGIVDGRATADNVVFAAVAGATCEALVTYSRTTSRLIAYVDSVFDGLPVTPNGGSITVVWSEDGIFAL